MPSHRRMRSYFLKLAHTFSTPISSLSSHARSKHKHDHDFLFTISSETKINDKLLPLPWLSLSTTPSSTFFLSFFFFFFFSLLYVLRTKRSMRSSATWKFKFPREEAESEWPPACTLCSKEIDFARACSRTSSGSWYSGTGWLEEVFTERNGANEIGDSL